jgi:hypothetical protein
VGSIETPRPSLTSPRARRRGRRQPADRRGSTHHEKQYGQSRQTGDGLRSTVVDALRRQGRRDWTNAGARA